MTITSHAQNFEDVILWRALKHVDRGFYVDIGAQDPLIDSVSLAFYEQGWRGVHVEPTAHYANKIRAARPDEEVIEAAIGLRQGEISFFEIADTGLSTGSEEIARKHEADGFPIKLTNVPCIPLSQVLDTHGQRDIHWLKIDVEGMEREVIESWAGSPVRPWIVVVESTRPGSPEPNFEEWEPRVLAHGYDFVYFDGLNRFYVSAEHLELKACFAVGPNVFDRFYLAESSPFCAGISAQLVALRENVAAGLQEAVRLSRALETAQAEAASHRMTFARAASAWDKAAATLTKEVELKNATLASLHARMVEFNRLKDELAAVYGSTSWRCTAPLRRMSNRAKWFARGMLAWITLKSGSRPRRLIASAMKPFRVSTHEGGDGLRQAHPVQEGNGPQEGSALGEPHPSRSVPSYSAAIRDPVVSSYLDTSDEPAHVKSLYWQFIRERKHLLERRSDGRNEGV